VRWSWSVRKSDQGSDIAEHRIRVTVNGEPVETFEDTVLYDHDQIVIYYEAL